MAINARNLPLDEHNQELDYDTRTDGQPVYVGKAPAGAKTTDQAWTIWKYSYNGSDQFIRKRMGQDGEGKTKHVWSDRTSLRYET